MESMKRRYDSEGKLEAKKRFDALINSRRSECLSENSKLALQDAVFQLIAHHHDVDELLAECDDHGGVQADCCQKEALSGRSGEKLSSQNDQSLMTVFSLTSFIQDKARILRLPVAIVAANVCAEKMTEIFGKRVVCETGNQTVKGTPVGLTSTDKKRFGMVMKTAQEFVRIGSFNRLHFTKLICREEYLPLYVTWQLHRFGVVPMDMFFLQKQKDSHFVRHFCDQLKDSFGGNEDEEFIVIIKDVFSFLVSKGYSENSEDSSDLRKMSVAILEHWLTDLVHSLTQPGTEPSEAKKPAAELPVTRTSPGFISLLMSSKELDKSTLKRFSTQIIYHLAKQGSRIKVSEAIKNQHLWTYAKSPEGLTSLIKQLFLLMTSGEIGSILKTVVQQQDVQWCSTLTLTSTFLLCFPDAPSILKDMLRELLGTSMENCDSDQLACVFLLARQACHEGPHIFPPYRDWFWNMFGDSSKSPANNRKSFMFLMKFLSDIVPFETPLHLKVHILKPPFVPSKCREVLLEYQMLARTRLTDLKDPINPGGVEDMSEPGTNSDRVMAQKLESEIEKALAVFESSGKIPPLIIEASIFRKPYYLGRFLPALLKERPLPDIPDIQMKLIEELKRAEKLPLSMYSSYVKACEREKSQLLDGLCIDDDSMEDALLEPMEQLKYRLNQLLQTLSEPKGEKGQTGLKDVLSHVSEKLETVLAGQETAEVSQACAVLCITGPQLTHVSLQVVDALLNTVCRMVVQVGSRTRVLAEGLLGLVKMLTCHPAIYPALVARLYKLIREQGPGLEAHHISGVAAILICLGSTSHLWQTISMHETNMSATELVQYLIAQLYHHTSQWMTFSLRFCTSYLQQSFCLFSSTSVVEGSDACAYVPKSVVQKFMYLSCRLIPGLQSESWDSGEISSGWSQADHSQLLTTEVSVCIVRSKVFQDLFKQCQLSFADWIKLELDVVPASDCLSETDRYSYYLHMTHDVYIPRELSEGGCGQSYAEACSQLLIGILQNSCGVRNHMACPHCQHEDLKAYSGHRNRQGMLLLLQNLSVFLVNRDCQAEQTVDEGSRSGMLPWLLQAMLRVMNGITENEGQSVQLLLQDFFRVAQGLSPSLFFTNNLSETCEGYLQGAADIINTALKDHLTQGCCLPFHLTAYLLQGLCAVSRCVTDRCNIRRLLDRCPVLVTSLLFHWKRLGRLTRLFLESCGAGTQTAVVQARTWAISCFEGIVSRVDGQPEWLHGVALVAMALERRCQPQSRIGPQLQLICPQVLSPLAECLAHCLTWSRLFTHKAQTRHTSNHLLLEEIFLQVISLQPVIISDICLDERDSFVRKNLIGPGLNKLKSATLLDLMTKLEKAEMADIFKRYSLDVTVSLLRLHVSVGQLYDSMGLSPGSDNSDISLPVNMNGMHHLRSYLIFALENLSVAELSNLDQMLVQTCDPVIRGVFSRRLAQR